MLGAGIAQLAVGGQVLPEDRVQDVAVEVDYARLLDAAHQQLGSPIVLVWDNLTAHRDALMRSPIESRPWLFYLPSYAPELNPTEGVRSHLKRSLGNLPPSPSTSSGR